MSGVRGERLGPRRQAQAAPVGLAAAAAVARTGRAGRCVGVGVGRWRGVNGHAFQLGGCRLRSCRLQVNTVCEGGCLTSARGRPLGGGGALRGTAPAPVVARSGCEYGCDLGGERRRDAVPELGLDSAAAADEVEVVREAEQALHFSDAQSAAVPVERPGVGAGLRLDGRRGLAGVELEQEGPEPGAPPELGGGGPFSAV